MPPQGDSGAEQAPAGEASPAVGSRKVARPYQIKAIAEARAAYRSGKRAILLVCPTGGGKTYVGSRIVDGAIAKGGTVLWLAHREELLVQAQRAIMAEGLSDVGIIAPWARRQHAKVQVASVQTLVAQLRKGRQLPPASVVVFDECVTADTKIGGLRADEVRAGDMVPAWDGQSVVWRRVSRVSARRANLIITLQSGGNVLRCSDNHPIWIEGRGYVRADEVREGDLCRVWCAHERLWAGSVGEDVLEGLSHCHAAPTQPGVCDLREADVVEQAARVARDVQRNVREPEAFADDGGDEPRACGRADAEAQPYAQCADTCEDGGNATGDRAPAAAGRQRSSYAGAAGCAPGGAGPGMGTRIGGRHGEEDARCTVALHDRPGSPGEHDGSGGGRPWSQRHEGAGCTQGCVSRLARVDRVEVHERASDVGFDRLCPGGMVYNFTVEGEHNFFANGILTHNCHHFVSEEWGTVAKAIVDAKGNPPAILGLTATPERGDGRPLGDLFDCLIPVSSVRELQELGVLVPCVTYRPEHKTKALAREPVEAYRERGWGERCFCFCVTVAHAEMIAETFRQAGVPAATIHDKTPWALRRARLEAFQSQDPTPLRKVGSPEDAPLVLCNVYTLTEGVDVPEASVCILARGCGHDGMLVQMVGRVGRAAPWAGKERCIVWDLRGVTHKLGLWEAERAYSLEGKAMSATSEKDDPPRRCKACGAVFMTWRVDKTSGARSCPQCGEAAPAIEIPDVVEREVFAAGSGASEADQMSAIDRLAMTAADRGYRSGWVSVRYSEQFGKMPPRGAVDAAMLKARKALGIRVTEGEIQAERDRLYAIAREKNIPLSWVEKKIAEKYGEAAA